MREVNRELSLASTPEATFALLHTPSAIREWWSAARVIVAARPGGLWSAAWGGKEDDPEYVTAARILAWEPPKRLRLGQFEYYPRDGQAPPFAATLVTEFAVDAAPGGCVLRVRQTGFPDPPSGDEFFHACQRGWGVTFEGIQRFVDRGGRSSASVSKREG